MTGDAASHRGPRTHEDVVTTGADGAQLRLTPHGGQVLGWRPVSGPERLWRSPLLAPPVLRGGVPVIFPQFSDRGPLAKHGFARDRLWTLLAAGDGRAMLTLTDDEQTRELWPHPFSLVLSAEARADRLEVDLTVHNPGPTPWTFAAALHSYLAVGRAADTVVEGLGGHRAQDNAAGLAEQTLPDGPFAVQPPVDLAVLGADGPRRLVGADGGDLWLTTGGFTDTVLWNPGERLPADVPADEGPRFVCLEAALLTPHALEPGGTWRGSMRLSTERADGPQAPNGVQPA